MARVITFSRVFPAKHPKKGEQTNFVEKILTSLNVPLDDLSDEVKGIIHDFGYATGRYKAKKHTIRAGNRWKVGDTFSPRVWSGKPYASKQIAIAPDMALKRVVDISISNGLVKIGDSFIRPKFLCNVLAMNDGLEIDDFNYWFGSKPFSGQILIWQDDITIY